MHQHAPSLKAQMNELADATAKEGAERGVAVVQTRNQSKRTWEVQGEYVVHQGTREVKCYPPTECRKEVINVCHNLQHEVTEGTLSRVQELACWPGMEDSLCTRE